MLKTNNLKFSYTEDKIFNFPNINLESSETLLILGNSGSGKSTLLNILGLILKPESGFLAINGIEPYTLNNKEIVEFRAQNIGLVYQKPYFVNSLNALDNLLIANYLCKRPSDKNHAMALAKSLDIQPLLNKNVNSLSGGEQQRISIARALMNTPKLILADEPTSALDDSNCEKVIELLENQAKSIGASLIIVTHDQRLKSKFNHQINLK
jgi:putative ABC transport system ATP-binding protein